MLIYEVKKHITIILSVEQYFHAHVPYKSKLFLISINQKSINQKQLN